MNFYLLYGDDKSILNREIDKIKGKLDIGSDDLVFYDINDVNDIVEEALTVSMFSLNKLVIIDATSYLSEKKEIKNINILENYFDNYNSNSYLIFVSNSCSIDSKKKLVKLISGRGEVKKIEASEDYLFNYVKDYLVSSKYKISNSDLSFFFK